MHLVILPESSTCTDRAPGQEPQNVFTHSAHSVVYFWYASQSEQRTLRKSVCRCTQVRYESLNAQFLSISADAIIIRTLSKI